ncbi:DUF1476 domain-containing protein [Denitrobaculum tricleocarpae]|uniref:DUF1476 domain-containing protein n=1 Tax=Denitrobaculum tricleocarpae TaxID=2591009 RepID=A0A545TU84_9PROT|nr:DUF1476 domain-containing protein [Denitrobaculum tricleocarpae]TQV80721.1 DUF1476 domain-containing protein [Denitrobaculum tricleocarpae]
MSTFSEREKAFEDKYKHDQELQFKVEARRNKLVGLWAAEQMGLSGGDADAYAKEVVMADMEEPGDDDVKRKILADFSEKSVNISAHQLDKKMEEMIAAAKEQVMAE